MLLVVSLFSCQSETVIPEQGECTLVLNMKRIGVSNKQTRTIDNDLALKILDDKGEIYMQYAAGNVPPKLVLEPGTFTIHAFTENQNTWQTENSGRGTACYYGTQQVTMEYDRTTYANMQVPMTNYAVTLTLPELFEDLFLSYTYTLKSGGRQTTIKQGEKAYFATEDGGFTYQLTATNTDNNTHHTSPITYKDVECGKLYNMTYYYGSDDNSGGLDIEITDNMEDEDVDVDL